ncbi:hypothetical protein FGRMN_5391 [Fusarium graminum]|nr:hypothetical protein FGRMN_5391 [Fusarium graminum]
MATLTKFDKFPELPLEVRRRIWKLALHLDCPRAYFVDVILPPLDLQEPQQEDERAVQRVPQRATIDHAPPGYLPPNHPSHTSDLGSSTALKRVCYESRREVSHSWRCFRPNGPVHMYLDIHDIYFPTFPPYELRGEVYGRLGEPSVIINGRIDLLVIEQFRLDCYVIDHEYALDAIAERDAHYYGLENAEQVAIPYYGNDEEDPAYDLYVERIQIVFPNLRTLYVYTAPENLSDDSPLPRRYLAQEENEDTAPISFITADRSFYELDPTKLEEQNLLTEPMRVFHMEDKPVDLRFLSWFWA